MISLREAREAFYWLRVCLAVSLLPSEQRKLQDEAEELVRILSAIVLRTKRNSEF
jgi:four helix bundle protein